VWVFLHPRLAFTEAGDVLSPYPSACQTAIWSVHLKVRKVGKNGFGRAIGVNAVEQKDKNNGEKEAYEKPEVNSEDVELWFYGNYGDPYPGVHP